MTPAAAASARWTRCPRGRRRHLVRTPDGAAGRASPRPAGGAAAGQCRHPAAQARRRRGRRHPAGRRRPARLGPGRADRLPFDPHVFVPEAGQGALALQVREGEEHVVAALDHRPHADAGSTPSGPAWPELGGGCTVPVAALRLARRRPAAAALVGGRMTVYLVGAGPGDPGLLTLRGRELLERCDALVYDRLADPRIVAMARPGAELHYAGKAPGRHTMTQDADQRPAGRAGPPAPDGRPAQGRRPVHLRPRRRGGAGAGRRRASSSRSCPASPRPTPSRPTRASP